MSHDVSVVERHRGGHILGAGAFTQAASVARMAASSAARDRPRRALRLRRRGCHAPRRWPATREARLEQGGSDGGSRWQAKSADES